MLKKTQKKTEKPFRLSLKARLRLLKRSIFGTASAETQEKKKNLPYVHQKSAFAKDKGPKREKSIQRRSSVKKAIPGEPAVKTAAAKTEKSGKPQKKTKQPSAQVKKKLPCRAPLPMPELVPPPPEEGKTRFFDLDLAPEILAGTQALNFRYCTVIQEKCLPYALEGKDLAAKAQTGTGKTAAFLASSMTRLLRNPLPPDSRKPGACRVLVLSPTRELAIQIHNDALALGKYAALNNLVIFGGMDHQAQRNSLADPIDILVGTPGRIIDYSRSGHLDLSSVEILVIDEADRMLDMGFIPDVRRIVAKLPPAGKRQTMLFSATLEPEVLALVDRWLVDPVSLEAEPEHVVTDLIDQHFYAVLNNQKLAMLLWLIRNEPFERMIIFGNWKEKNIDLVDHLYEYGVQAGLLSGDIPQAKRLKILEKFKSGEVKIVVATDVAARGIHIAGISHVVNYDLPDHPEDYVHRIGRTGRAGARGKSISFVCEYGAYVMPEIEKYAQIVIKTIQPEEEMLVLPERVNMPVKRSHSRSSSAHRGGGRRLSTGRSSRTRRG